ncbi:MAG: hypothetical protein WC544_05105, partial [Patescibacteria group bacterium]
MKRFALLACVLLLVSVTFFEETLAQQPDLQLVFNQEGNYPQDLQLIFTNLAGLDSVGISNSYLPETYGIFFDTSWFIDENTLKREIRTCLFGQGHREYYGECPDWDSVTWVVDFTEERPCTLVVYDGTATRTAMSAVVSNFQPVWPEQCWRKLPFGGYAIRKPGKSDTTFYITRVNDCGDTSGYQYVYDEDLWELVATPPSIKDTLKYDVYPEGWQHWDNAGNPVVIERLDTVLVMYVCYSGSSEVSRKEIGLIIDWTNMTYQLVDPEVLYQQEPPNFDITVLYDYGGCQTRLHTFLSTGASFAYQGNPGWLIQYDYC